MNTPREFWIRLKDEKYVSVIDDVNPFNPNLKGSSEYFSKFIHVIEYSAYQKLVDMINEGIPSEFAYAKLRKELDDLRTENERLKTNMSVKSWKTLNENLQVICAEKEYLNTKLLVAYAEIDLINKQLQSEREKNAELEKYFEVAVDHAAKTANYDALKVNNDLLRAELAKKEKLFKASMQERRHYSELVDEADEKVTKLQAEIARLTAPIEHDEKSAIKKANDLLRQFEVNVEYKKYGYQLNKLQENSFVDGAQWKTNELKNRIKHLEDKVHSERKILNEQHDALMRIEKEKVTRLRAALERLSNPYMTEPNPGFEMLERINYARSVLAEIGDEK